MVDTLVFHCWPFEVRMGQRAESVEAARRALDRWTSMGLACRVEHGARFFDPIEVLNFRNWVGFQGKDSIWLEHCVGSLRRMSAGPRNESPPTQGHYDPTRFDVAMSYRIEQHGERPGTYILPLPYRDPTQRDISWSMVDVAGAEVDLRASPGRLLVKTKHVSDRFLSLNLRVRFTSYRCGFDLGVARGQSLPVDPSQELYLRSSDRIGHVRVSDRIASLAQELRGGPTTTIESLERLWEFCFRKLQCGWLDPRDLGQGEALEFILDNRWFDCGNGASLVTSLGRALGVPARVVGGYILSEEAPTFHYWLEFHVHPIGWFPADLLNWMLAAARYDDAVWAPMGRLDHRMKVHCLPRIISPLFGADLPAERPILVRMKEEGAEFFATEPGSDEHTHSVSVAVTRAPDAAPLTHPVTESG